MNSIILYQNLKVMETKIKAAGYVRVSSKEQVDGESLSTQRKSITDFALQHDYKLTEIYADEGISGGTVKDRHALLRCLQDGQNGKFKVLIIHRLSRFGRNARELLKNHKELKGAGIELISISEKIDFTSSYGEFMLIMLAAVAQLERDIIREQMLENRIAGAKKGMPTVGKKPYGREFNKETKEWTVDDDAVKLMTRVADEFLSGKSTLREIARTTPMSYQNKS
jgi:site-specific DNA recombinase